MEYSGRRNRRGRPRSRIPNQQVRFAQRPPTSNSYNGFCSFFILASLIAMIYLKLDHHCKICSKKYDGLDITKSINDIAVNISRLKASYTDLEKSITKFSGDIPKIEGQIEILEALANTMERGDSIWNPKTHLTLPNVDVFLKEPNTKITENPYIKKNVTEKITQYNITPTD
ncbi:uncharacterized protein LOC123871600 isoform X2 [Maniola jurtina]|uniref:uncharacterized protein LOC123871600 isoform X2 n=1 Tax=Maniola jurtina TaxID=191418 RepID=UPI001E68FB57|nr:uncharacterized protein LOC123871600 isoform X2 [Maniola jurtina]